MIQFQFSVHTLQNLLQNRSPSLFPTQTSQTGEKYDPRQTAKSQSISTLQSRGLCLGNRPPPRKASEKQLKVSLIIHDIWLRLCRASNSPPAKEEVSRGKSPPFSGETSRWAGEQDSPLQFIFFYFCVFVGGRDKFLLPAQKYQISI